MAGAPTRIVVVGSSAGGIDALSKLMATLPADLDAPIVIAQHLDPRRASHLADILGRQGAMPVRVADQRTPLQDRVAFVVPPNRNVRIEGRDIVLLPAESGTVAPSVDLLFKSAAEAFGPGAIAVILSGSGSDGAAGAADVKGAGGVVLVENPGTAAFASMPASVPSALVDGVIDIKAMAAAITQLMSEDPRHHAGEDVEFARFLEGLRERTGVEFGAYKEPTIRRRLQGRMEATGQATVGDYLAYLEQHPSEQQRVFGHLLVKVTEFFRDPKLFDYLAATVLPELVEDAAREGRELRIWSAGCSTGEEGYSLGIAAVEAILKAGAAVTARVFATDVDPEALAIARRGRYPVASLADMPKDLLERYFLPADGGYEVVKPLRAMTVFGEHDLAQRAPFPRIDLIVCQNVLIYFTQPLQRVALETFAFSLRPGGVLALGSSETAGALPEPFAEESQRPRIYRRTQHQPSAPLMSRASLAAARRPVMPASTDHTAEPADPSQIGVAAALLARADQQLLDLTTGVVAVDSHYIIGRINATARRLLGVHGTATGQDFIHLAEVFPSSALRALVDSALAGNPADATFEIESPDETAADSLFVSVRTRPRRAPGISIGRRQPAEGVVIELIDVTDAERERRTRIRAEQRLEKSGATVRRLRKANEELTELVDELRSLNDILRFATEDSQTGREELETLNEEFQATNEELETVNEELTASVDELRSTNDELAARTAELRLQTVELEEEKRASDEDRGRLRSILASIGDAIVAVDQRGATVATNPAYDRFLEAAGPQFALQDFNGRPIPPEQWPQRRAARGESFHTEFAVRTPGGTHQWYEAIAEPLTFPDRSWGGVVTLRDISERTMRISLERLMAAASHELRTPLAALHGYLQLVDRHLRQQGPAPIARYALQALVQTRQMGTLLDLLFDVSRVRSGHLTLDTEKVDVVEVVRRAAETVQAIVGSPPMTVTAPRDTVMVLGDATRLEQVIINVLGNAVEHAETPRVEVSIRRARNRVRVKVRDFGVGIDPKTLPDLFEPYRPLQSADAPASAGLGLGLFLSREIVLAHGGAIHVASTLGEGTVVTITLPLIAQPAAAAKPSKRPKR